MTFEASILNEYLKTINAFLDKNKLSKYVVRTWIFKDKCAVVDFAHGELKFAFDFTPVSADICSLDLLQRKSGSKLRVTPVEKNKVRLSGELPLTAALTIAEKKVLEIIVNLNNGVVSVDTVSSRRSESPSSKSLSPVVRPLMRDNEIAHANPLCRPLNVLCTGCGVCVSESRESLQMTLDEDGFLVPQAIGRDVPVSAVKVCPFNPDPDKEVLDEDVLGKSFLSEAKNFDSRAGRYETAYVGYSKEYRPSSSSGGIATYVFDQLLRRGEVDYLFVVQTDDRSGYKYRIFDKNDDIRKISKTRYTPVSLDELFSVIEKKGGRVAVSGVACFIKAIRLKQHYHPELKKRIPFLLGIICGGLKSQHYTDYLAQSAGISGAYTNPNYRVKDSTRPANEYSFSASDANFQVHEIKMSRLGDMWGSGLFKAKACDFCTDVLTELADISLGDAWLPEYMSDGLGNSVIITRSKLAENIIQSGLASGELVINQVPVDQISRSQRGGFVHKRAAVKFRVWMAKNFSRLPVPVVRPRLLSNLSVAEALIQVRRERARSKSLLSWKHVPEAERFRKRMNMTLKDLRVATAARKIENYDPLVMGQAMTRWALRKLRRNEINFDALRAVLLKKNPAPKTKKVSK